MDPQLANLNLDPPRPLPLWRRGLLPALLVNAVFFAGVALSLHWPGVEGQSKPAAQADAASDTRSMGAAPTTNDAAQVAAPAQTPQQPQPQAVREPQPQAQPQSNVTPKPQSEPAQPQPRPQRTSDAAPVGLTTPVSVQRRSEAIARLDLRPHRPASDGSASKARQAGAVQPSFDCAKAHSRNERLICSDPQLAQLDRDTGRLHARAKAAARDAAAFKRQNDREWKLREAQCRDKACLLAWYGHRRQQLQQTVAQAH
jgi:outer membrane biosynthesis protein TonB